MLNNKHSSAKRTLTVVEMQNMLALVTSHYFYCDSNTVHYLFETHFAINNIQRQTKIKHDMKTSFICRYRTCGVENIEPIKDISGTMFPFTPIDIHLYSRRVDHISIASPGDGPLRHVLSRDANVAMHKTTKYQRCEGNVSVLYLFSSSHIINYIEQA